MTPVDTTTLFSIANVKGSKSGTVVIDGHMLPTGKFPDEFYDGGAASNAYDILCSLAHHANERSAIENDKNLTEIGKTRALGPIDEAMFKNVTKLANSTLKKCDEYDTAVSQFYATPKPADPSDIAIDQEIRAQIRSMTSVEINALRESLLEWRNARVVEAVLRSPIPIMALNKTAENAWHKICEASGPEQHARLEKFKPQFEWSHRVIKFALPLARKFSSSLERRDRQSITAKLDSRIAELVSQEVAHQPTAI
ncbi:MAG: hypothetical protein LBQ20_03445 [Rhodanobacter sp.]|jgi:hypothetical protein|nr:hypothetical protein [Rhodanobacter sp.]